MDGGSIEVKENEPVKVNKFHFLIHPGYDSDRDIKDDVTPDDELLLDKYLEQSKKLGSDELMLVFCHKNFKELRKSFQNGDKLGQTLRDMKKVLGNRMVLVTNQFDVFDSPEAFQKVLSIIKGRGYDFGKDAETFAYGETFGLCVPDGAENLNRNAGFAKKTVIIPELTDFAKYSPRAAARTRARIERDKSETVSVEFGMF